MKHSNKLEKITLDDVENKIRSLMKEEGAETFIGSMMASDGIFIMLFSCRQNKDFSFLVNEKSASPVLDKVFSALARSV